MQAPSELGKVVLMGTLGEWLGIIGGIAGLIVLLSGALVYVRGSYSKARIESLAATVHEYEQREQLHTREIQELKHTVEAQGVKITALENENQVLTGALTQRAEVSELRDMLDHHHQEALRAWADIVKAIRDGVV